MTPGAPMTVFERMSKINAPVGALAAILGAASWFHPTVAGSDLWWHLAAGRELWRTGSLLRLDPFSHTFAGRPWTNHEWLWEALYWPAYQLHPDLVACLNLTVLVCVFGLAGWIAWRTSGSLLAASASIWLAAAASHWFLDIRPHLFSLLVVGVVLVTRERRWAPWMWPPLFAVWVNLHGGFVFGLGVVGLHVLFRTAEASRVAGRIVLPRTEWLSLSLCGVAILLNPYGYRILEYPLAYLDSASRFRTIIEWHPPGFSLDPRSFQGRFYWMAAAVALGVPRGVRRAPYFVALALVTFAMAFTARRFIPLFAVTAAPVAALGLAMVQEQIVSTRKELRGPVAGVATALGALVLAVALWWNVRFFPQPLYRWTQSELYPVGALRYLLAFPNPPERPFNLYNWGGFMMLHGPEIPVFMDGRANTLYDEQHYDDYLDLYTGRAGARQVLRKYQVDAVLVPNGAGIARTLMQGPEPWEVVYSDPVSLLLLPPSAGPRQPPLPSISRVLEDSEELWMRRGQLAFRRGRLKAAEEALEHALAMNPLLVPAHSLLIQVAARRRDREALDRWSRRAIDLYPRQAGRIYRHVGQAYEQLGDLPAALDAYRKSVPRGPFTSPEPVKARIRKLETRIQGRDGAKDPPR